MLLQQVSSCCEHLLSPWSSWLSCVSPPSCQLGHGGWWCWACWLSLAALCLQALLKNASATVHHAAQVTSVERLSSGKWQLEFTASSAASQESIECSACWHVLLGLHMGPAATDRLELMPWQMARVGVTVPVATRHVPRCSTGQSNDSDSYACPAGVCWAL